MKKLTALVIILALPLLVSAQSKAVTSFIDKYIDHEDVTYVQVKGSLFKLISSIAEYDNGEEPDEDLQALGRISSGISSMTVLKVPYLDTDLSKEDVANLRSSLSKEKYEEYMKVKEGKEMVTIMAQGSGKEVTNGLIMVEEKDGVTLIAFNGTILVKDLNYLSKHHDDWH
jgi:hypothetical protein